jgi:hypothetical protein
MSEGREGEEGLTGQQECPYCGIKFVEFRNSGRLGCPHDYIGFAAEPTSAGVDKTVEKEFVAMATQQEWTAWVKEQTKASTSKRVVIDKLFIDYFLD